MSTNIFEKASRLKLTIATTRGQLPVDQLWDLPLKGTGLSLNTIAVTLKKVITKNEDLVDLVDGDGADSGAVEKQTHDKLRFDIVMHIISVLKAERDAREAKEALASQLRQIDEAIAQKQAAELTNGTVEDLIKKREAILAGSKPTL
jgi:hypothetical protein